MKEILCWLWCLLGLTVYSHAQPCNSPAPPSDSCNTAPLFCAAFVGGYCSATTGYNADVPGNLGSLLSCNIDNNSWIRLSPCEDSLWLAVGTSACGTNSGIELALLSTDDCLAFSLIQDCQSISSGQTDTIGFGNLTPGATYYLMIDGIDGDFCNYSITTLSGMEPPVPGPLPDTVDFLVEELSPATIDGPDYVCFGETATYTYHPPVCQLSIGDCDTLSNRPVNSTPLGCLLPEEACRFPELIIVDTFLVWHLPDGAIFIGDSTGYTVDVLFDPFQSCIDSTYSDSLFSVDTACTVAPVIPTDSSGMLSDTIFQEVWVEIGFVFLIPPDSTPVSWVPSVYDGIIPDSFYWENPAYENVYCPCPAGRRICGTCDYIASRESGVIIEYSWDSQTICEPDCADFCGASLCSGGQYWCRADCGFDILSLSVEQPEIIDLGAYDLCPWDCFYLPANGEMYCGPGSFDIPVLNPVTGCTDHYLFVLHSLPEDEVVIESISHLCSADSSSYTVTINISGTPPFFVNNTPVSGNIYISNPILNGEPYSFLVESIGPCPDFESLAGSYDCDPCTADYTDLGNIQICEGECYDFNSQPYCDAGEYIVEIPDGEGLHRYFPFRFGPGSSQCSYN